MDCRIDYRQEGYQKGFVDGKRTGGLVRKAYVDNLLQEETQHLSTEDSLAYKKAWHEGFADGVLGVINNMVKKEGLLTGHI